MVVLSNYFDLFVRIHYAHFHIISKGGIPLNLRAPIKSGNIYKEISKSANTPPDAELNNCCDCELIESYTLVGLMNYLHNV